MYPEVTYPTVLLYSIYIDGETQYNTVDNYTQSILSTRTTQEQVVYGFSGPRAESTWAMILQAVTLKPGPGPAAVL
jgi:hypothetical protein